MQRGSYHFEAPDKYPRINHRAIEFYLNIFSYHKMLDGEEPQGDWQSARSDPI